MRSSSASRPADPLGACALIVVICGPSGAGKGTIAAGLLARDDRLSLSRSWTTRPRRPSDSPDSYVFVDRAAFLERVAADGFLEWAEVFGNLYGTPTPDVAPGCDLLLEIDIQGAQQVRERHPDALVIFIRPPSRAEQEARLRGRGDSEQSILGRLAKADEEEAVGLHIADAVVVNDDVDRAVAEVAGIVERRRREGPAAPGSTQES